MARAPALCGLRTCTVLGTKARSVNASRTISQVQLLCGVRDCGLATMLTAWTQASNATADKHHSQRGLKIVKACVCQRRSRAMDGVTKESTMLT